MDWLSHIAVALNKDTSNFTRPVDGLSIYPKCYWRSARNSLAWWVIPFNWLHDTEIEFPVSYLSHSSMTMFGNEDGFIECTA